MIYHQRVLLGLCGLAIIGNSGAQTASPTSDLDQSEEAINLSPFVVSGDKDVGYLAGNTLAGSRMNQSLKDTAASISIFTPEFLSDIGARDLTDAMSYAVNAEMELDDDRAANPNGTSTIADHQQYRVRGLRASISRNYSNWGLSTDMYNVSRVEDSRGPNSVLFGIGSPGGVINSSSKQANTRRSFGNLGFTAGSFDSWRGTIDVNMVLQDDKLALRLNALSDQANNFRHWAFKENRRTELAVKYNFTDKTQFRAEYEYADVKDNQPRTWNLDDDVTAWIAAGRPTFATAAANAALGIGRLSNAAAQPQVRYISNSDFIISMRGAMNTVGLKSGVLVDPSLTDYSINIGGPAQTRYSKSNTLSAYLDHQFSDNTFLEIAYLHQDSTFDRYDPRSANGLKGDPNQLLLNGQVNPYAGQLMLEGSWFRLYNEQDTDTARATVSTEFDAGKWGAYRFAVFGEYQEARSLGATYREIWVDAVTGNAVFNAGVPENAQNLVFRRTYVNEGEWSSYTLSGANRDGLIVGMTEPVTGRTLSSAWATANGGQPNLLTSEQVAGMVVGQAKYLDGRLVLGAGIRRDEIDDYLRGRVRDSDTEMWIVAPSDAEADPAQQPSRETNSGTNKTLGAVFHLTPKFSVFVNAADNISLPERGAQVMNLSGEPGALINAPAPKGRGMDAGVALNLLDGKLYARATYYTTASQGQSTTFPSRSEGWRNANTRILDSLLGAGLISQSEYETRSDIGSRQTFDHSSEGYELQITANPSRNWRFQANYSYTDAVEDNKAPEWKAFEAQNIAWLATINTTGVITDSGQTIAAEVAAAQADLAFETAADGLSKYGNRHHKVSLFSRYGFSDGALKGAFVGGGLKYQSKSFAGLDMAGDEVYGNSFTYVDFLVGYSMRNMPKKHSLKFQLNVYNVFDKDDPLITRYNLDGSVYRFVVQPPITWRFSVDYGF